jgi:hypothetical protein
MRKQPKHKIMLHHSKRVCNKIYRNLCQISAASNKVFKVHLPKAAEELTDLKE